jgi:hypothetical protein
MNKYYYLILTIIFLPFTSRAGDADRIPVESDVFILYQDYTIDAYNAAGFSNALYSTISDLPNANPASLVDYDKPGIGLGMEYQTGIDNAFATGHAEHDRISQYIPQSFAAIYPIWNFRLGLGFYQKYSGRIDLGKFPITTGQNPDSVIGYFAPNYRRYIYSGNVIASKNFKNLFGKDHQLSLGIQLNLDYFRMEESVPRIKATGTDQAFSWKVGIRYSYLDLLSLAAIFDKGSSFTGNIEYSPELVTQLPMEYKFRLKTPDKLILGYYLQSIPWLWINGSVNLVYWSQVYNTLKNNLDYSVNFIINGNEKYSYSIGYYNTDVKTEESYYISASNYNAHYLSGGFRARIEPMAIYVTIMDSHLSTKTRRQTISKLGVEYQF